MKKITLSITLEEEMASICKEAGCGNLTAFLRMAAMSHTLYRKIEAGRKRNHAKQIKESEKQLDASLKGLKKQAALNNKSQAKADMEWQKLLAQVKAIQKKKGTVPMNTDESIMHKVLTPEQYAASVLRDLSLDEGGTCYDGYRMSDSEDERRAKVALIGCSLLTLELMDEARRNSPFRSHFTVPAF